MTPTVFIASLLLSSGLLGASHVQTLPRRDAAVVCPKDATSLEQFAAREVRRYVYLRTDELLPVRDAAPNAGDAIVVVQCDRAIAGEAQHGELKAQEYMLKTRDADGRRVLYIVGGSDVGTLYGAYRFAEHLGVRFYLHGDVIPDARVPFALPQLDERGSPLFDLRGIQPFHDFPEGPDWWNPEDYKAIVGQLPKLGINFLGLHTYPENRPAAEPTVWIGASEDVASDGSVQFAYPAIYYNTLLAVGWGYAPKATNDYSFGAGAMYDRNGYGSEIMRGLDPTPLSPRDCNEVFNRAGAMFREVFTQAHAMGIKTCVGTETPLVVPQRVHERIAAQAGPFAALGGKVVAYPEPVAGTDDGPLYQSVRFDLKGYRFNVPNGAYRVTLKFCEVAFDKPGIRVFDVAIQGKRVMEGLDICARVGKDKALDCVFENVKVDDGHLAIDFNPRRDYPSIAGIIVEDKGLQSLVSPIKVNCGGSAYKDYLADNATPPLDRAAIQRLYEGMFTRIARAYPIDYYWFWTPEGWTWEGVKEETVKAALDDIRTAIAAAQQVHAPFTLATCGWVLGPQYDRALFDKVLPKEMPVSCINRQVGMEPVDRGFADVAGRPKWAIPWMEDDPALNSPQLWAGRMRRDAFDARKYGCTGLMGIHWRTRILGPNVSALARAAWEQGAWADAKTDTGGVIGGQVATFPNTDFADTDDDALYQTVRYDVSAYRIPVPNGVYAVTLRLCEPHYKEKGKRVFGLKVQDKTPMVHLDVFNCVGGNRAYNLTYRDVKAEDRMRHIGFTKEVEFPCIAAIDVEGPGFTRKINCGGPAYKDYEADLPAASEFRPVDDFYRDWALSEFGPGVAEAGAAIFTKIDCHLPRPSNWIGGPGGYAPDKRPWETVSKDYAFVDAFAALRENVKGAGNLERFDYWLSNFRFMRATAQMCCVWHEYSQAMEKVKAGDAPDKKRQLARELALPARQRLIAVVSEAYRNLLATVNTAGEMGSVTNLEQHTLPELLDKPGQELAAILGAPLPDDAQLPTEYHGPIRIFVPTVRTALFPGEALNVKVVILAERAPREALLHWRAMGQGRFKDLPLQHAARGVYVATLQPAGADVEYYVEVLADDGAKTCWPPTAPELNQTVVMAAGADGN